MKTLNRSKVIAEIHDLKERQKADKKREEELWEMLNLSKPLDQPETYDDYILNVEERSRFNAKTARANLTPEQFESILERVPTSGLAKIMLDDETYKIACCNQYLVRTIEKVTDDK